MSEPSGPAGIVATVYRGSAKPWRHGRAQRWRFKVADAGNHKILAVSSESYTNRDDAIETASRLAGEVEVFE